MHPATLRALEFPRVLEALTSFALTPLGAERLAALEPMRDVARVEAALAATTEGVRLLGEHPAFPLRAPSGLPETLQALAVVDRPLEPLRLLGLADFLDSLEQVRSLIRRLPRASFPTLAQLADSMAAFDHETRAIRHAIDPSGEVVDHASPELRQIRDRLRRQRSRLRGTLESYLRGRDTSKYLQDQVVTDRNGRYVLVVKSEHRHSIPGIVHGSSASGASLYLEPLSTVELNNDIVALEEQEAEEVRRILLSLSDAFRTRALDMRRTLEAATELDVIQAKARFAGACRASAPAISTDGRLELRAARHPLLIPSVLNRTHAGEGTRVQRESEPVPVDILLVPPTRVLVITGPNTGGKTVALKAAGLLSLMAQTGLHIPAEEGSAVPVFQSVFADIGDEQSIEANLSTFSWHVTNIAGMDSALRTPALVLLDELGAGTDPVEGGALGMAIVDHFRRRGALVIATTHYDALKSYASTTPEVVAAAFGFTPDTFVPTYRLMYGSPGSSLALEMAARLGLPPTIIEAARGFRSERDAQLSEHLARVDRELHALEHERRLVAQERVQIAALEAQLRNREAALREREEKFKQRVETALQERLRDARREIDLVVENVRRKADALAEQAARQARLVARPGGSPAAIPGLSTGETGGLRMDARGALDAIAGKVRGATSGGSAAPAVPEEGPAEVTPGMRVRLPLGLEGVVESVQARTAEVSVNGKRVRAEVGDLRVVGRAPAAAPHVTVHVNAPTLEFSSPDLNVVGCTVSDAIDRADKFIDQAILAEMREVRIIHGHGTGQLRRALGAFLAAHPQVARVSAAAPNQGGGGVTVVELKE
ncbi:MAG TPA: Smr/MutS family protein [Vicinamibacterales bacterium]